MSDGITDANRSEDWRVVLRGLIEQAKGSRTGLGYNRFALAAIGAHMIAYEGGIAELERQLAEARAENTRLRAALAQSDQPCAYCTLSREDWAKCAAGFPGCDRADDAMGCPELGASLERDTLAAKLAAVVKAGDYYVFANKLRLEDDRTFQRFARALTAAKEADNG